MSDAISRIIQEKREDLRELELFAEIALNGLDRATKAVQGIELIQKINAALGEPSPFPTDEALAEAKARAGEVEKFAGAQSQHGFSYLFGIVAIRLWSLLEAFVDDIAVEALKTPEKCKDRVLLSKLKGPLIEFRNASPDDQAEYLAETLKQGVEATLKQGVGKFEAILEPLGFGGGVADEVRKCLFELCHVRNTLVHKGSKADRRLIDACPWLGLARGDHIRLSAKDFRRYSFAGYWYLIEIKHRVKHRGTEPPRETLQLQDDLVAHILELQAVKT